MEERWRILAALTFARAAMGFQFQSVYRSSTDPGTAASRTVLRQRQITPPDTA